MTSESSRLPPVHLRREHRHHQQLQPEGQQLHAPLQPALRHLLAAGARHVLPLLLGRAVRAEQRAQLRQQLALDQEGGIHRLHLLQQGQPRVQLRHLRWLAGTVVHPVDTVSRSRGLHRVPGRPGPARRARHHRGQRQQVRGQEAGGRGAVVTETAARWCGRWMALPADPAPTPTITYSAVNSGTTLCSRLLPFRLRVMFDDGEVRLSAPGSWLTLQNIPPCRCSARTAARCAGPAAPRRARRTPRTSAPPSGCTAAARGRSASSSSGGTSAASSRQ